MGSKKPWKEKRDPLLRGDRADGVSLPTPEADPRIVRHILDLEGPGRDTPYLSTTEHEETARYFAGEEGGIYETTKANCQEHEVGHISRKDLLDLLKGDGKGNARWDSKRDILRARAYVEEHAEHLLDFRKFQTLTPEKIETLVKKIFKKHKAKS